MTVSFGSLPVGAEFRCNGAAYRKRSSRTAWLVQYDRAFYFSSSELVERCE